MFIDESCELTLATVNYQPKVKISFNKRLKETKDLNDKIVDINKVVDVKGDKAKGNQLTRLKVKEIILMDVDDDGHWPVEDEPVLINANSGTDTIESNDTIEDEKVINQPVVDTIPKEESKDLNVDTNSEGPVELEWDVDISSEEDKGADEDGQMKIF
jgi:topoisomerase-4 subunit A